MTFLVNNFNYFTRGEIHAKDGGGYSSAVDACDPKSDHKLDEWYCENGAMKLIKLYECSNGCKNGACIK